MNSDPRHLISSARHESHADHRRRHDDHAQRARRLRRTRHQFRLPRHRGGMGNQSRCARHSDCRWNSSAWPWARCSLAVSPTASGGARPRSAAWSGMSIGMFMATTVTGLVSLSIWRVITGLGIGGMLATINATAAEFSNERRKHLCVSLMAIGYPVGVVFGGTIAAQLLQTYDWRSVFYLGTTMTAVCIPLVYLLVPESVHWLAYKQPKGALECDQSHTEAHGARSHQRTSVHGVETGRSQGQRYFRARAARHHHNSCACVLPARDDVLLHHKVGAENRRRHGFRRVVRRDRPGLDQCRRCYRRCRTRIPEHAISTSRHSRSRCWGCRP